MAATQYIILQDFLLAAILLLAAVAPVPSSGLEDDRGQRPECVMWSKLENKTLPLQDQGHANCSTNDDCTGFDCVGIYQGKGLTFGMRVLPCLATPGVEIYGYAPQFNTKNFSHVFKHKSEYTVPGALLNLSLIPGATESGQEVGGKLEVHIQRNPGGKSLMMGLVLKACINDNCLLSKPVFNHTEIPVPECTNHVDSTKVNSVCSMNAMDACGPNQSCVQEEVNSNVGLCECLAGFVRQEDGTCLSKTDDEKISRNSASSSQVKPSHSPQPQVSEGTSGAAVAAGVVSVLVVLAILGAAAFVIFRTRLAPRLRARLTNTPYEDIVIGKRSESRQNVIA